MEGSFMSKFNRGGATGAVSAIKTHPTPTGRTHEGAPGYLRDTKSELFLLAVANMVSEDTFYEGSLERDARFRALVGEVARTDVEWLIRMVDWLRDTAGMRSASVVAAAEGVRARLEPAGPASRARADDGPNKTGRAENGIAGAERTRSEPDRPDAQGEIADTGRAEREAGGAGMQNQTRGGARGRGAEAGRAESMVADVGPQGGPSGGQGANRRLITAALRRADEPGELLAYWQSRYGRALPQPVKRGVADAARRLYNERSLIKYDTPGTRRGATGQGARRGAPDSSRRPRGRPSAAGGTSTPFRFGDVLELTHPAPRDPRQGELFRYAIDRRHGRAGQPPEALPLLRTRARLLALPHAERRALLDRPDADRLLADAGMTWESLASWLQGPLTAAFWESIIPAMGLFALLRNLRNFDQAGVSDETAARVAGRLTDTEEVARSRILPMRFLAAHRTAPSLRWAWPLQRALDISLRNVPALRGRTLVLVDRSGSMFGSMSRRSELTYADAAAVFGTAVALRAERADLVQFGTGHQRVRFRHGESVLKVVGRFGSMGGTNTAGAVRAHYRGHDRVMIVTDEQAWGGYHGELPTRVVPERIPVYTWNLVGYRHGHGPAGEGTRHTFAGLSDAAFGMIPLIEAGMAADWPF